jgi:hypothetical protein
MPSAFHQVINTEKYKNIDVRSGGVWTNPTKEIWVRNAGVWVEPKQIYRRTSGVWVKQTNITKFVQGSTTIQGLSSTANAWNMYVDNGATQAIYEFDFVLTTTGVLQHLFSYGLTDETNYFEIYIDTSNRVNAKSRYNSGTASTNTHASGLTANVHYRATIKTRTATNPKCTIDVVNLGTGAAVGVQKTTNTFPAYSTSPTPKYLLRRFSTTQNNFRGIVTRVYIYGAQSTSANKTTFDSDFYLRGSSDNGTDITNTNTSDYGNGISFTLTNGTIGFTG